MSIDNDKKTAGDIRTLIGQIQDLKVDARDVENFQETKIYKKMIKLLETRKKQLESKKLLF